MIRALMIGAAILALAGCTGVARGVAGAALGGGPNVAANVQGGKTNTQTVGTTQITEQKLDRVTADKIEQSTGDNVVRTERVERITVRNEAPPWVWLLLIAGWVLPSPGEITRALASVFARRKRD